MGIISAFAIADLVGWTRAAFFGNGGLALRAVATKRTSSKTVYFIRHGTAQHNVRFQRARSEVFKALIDARSKTLEDRENRLLFPEIEEWAYMTNETIDTTLTDDGFLEAQTLGSTWADSKAFLYDRQGKTGIAMPLAMRDVELVVTSPLTRTLQTTLHIFFKKAQVNDGNSQVDLVPRSSHAVGSGNIPIIALDLVKEWSQGRHTPNLRKHRSELAKSFPQVSFAALEAETDTMWQERWPGTKDGLEPRAHLENRVEQFRIWLGLRPEQNIVVVSHGTFLGNLLFGSFIDDKREMRHCQIYEGCP